MSFLNKIKELFANAPEQKAEKPSSAASISLDELPAKVESLVKEAETRNKKLKLEIGEQISSFSREMKNSVEIVKNVDLSKRKEYERVKIIVQDNLNLYIEQIKKLLSDLEKIDEKEPAGCFSRIFASLNEFSRVSHMPYEKATYLVGKEMASVRSLARHFGQNISALAEQNKAFFEETKQIKKLSDLCNELKESKRLEDSMKGDILEFNKKIEAIENEIKKLSDEILNIKNSADYLKEAEEKQEYLKKQEDLEKELQAIKQKIDFKALAKVFHNDKKKAQLIRDYSRNFKDALMTDETLKIVEMANDSQNLNLPQLKELKASIQSDSLYVSKTENKILEIEDKIKSLEIEKAGAKAGIEEKNKKLARIAKKKSEIVSELKGALAPMNLSLKD